MPRGKSNNYNYYYPQRSKVVGNRNKYSTQTYLVRNTSNLDAGASQYFTVVPPTDVAGKRKVKNISIQLAFDSQLTGAIDADASVFWCIVYVPKGSVPGAIGQLNGIFYTPPQFIMSSGIYNVKIQAILLVSSHLYHVILTKEMVSRLFIHLIMQ